MADVAIQNGECFERAKVVVASALFSRNPVGFLKPVRFGAAKNSRSFADEIISHV